VPVAVADAEPSEESVPYVSIILPCYNEEGHVTAEVERICAAMDTSGYSYEVLAIDDASTDQTLACLCEAASRFPNLEVVHFHRNGGSGVVRRIGTERARGQIVVWTDADMTYPNEQIPEFVQLLEKDETIDQVVGARTTEQGTYKMFRVPAKWFIRKLARTAHRDEDPGPQLGPAGVPARSFAAVPAAAAAQVLLRHHDHGRLPGKPA
jgi:glycosyltransferase involved in cell wall biosynthesis